MSLRKPGTPVVPSCLSITPEQAAKPLLSFYHYHSAAAKQDLQIFLLKHLTVMEPRHQTLTF